MATTTLTSKGQITLPKAIRERLALKQGDRLRVAVDSDGRMTLARETPQPIESVYGLLRRLARKRPVSLAEMRAALRQRAKRKQSGKRA
jgi:antitoxin PrlF